MTLSAIVDLVLAGLSKRVLTLALEHDAELAPLFEKSELALASSRPVDAGTASRLGLDLVLLVPARPLGRVLASPSLQDRLTSIVAMATAENEQAMLLDLDFGHWSTKSAARHPYRTSAALPTAAAVDADEDDLEHAASELVAGFFEGRANAPRCEVALVEDELVVTVFTDAMLFSSLAGPLRAAMRKLVPKVLLERRRA